MTSPCSFYLEWIQASDFKGQEPVDFKEQAPIASNRVCPFMIWIFVLETLRIKLLLYTVEWNIFHLENQEFLRKIYFLTRNFRYFLVIKPFFLNECAFIHAIEPLYCRILRTQPNACISPVFQETSPLLLGLYRTVFTLWSVFVMK
jgi:hypothetical protein